MGNPNPTNAGGSPSGSQKSGAEKADAFGCVFVILVAIIAGVMVV